MKTSFYFLSLFISTFLFVQPTCFAETSSNVSTTCAGTSNKISFKVDAQLGLIQKFLPRPQNSFELQSIKQQLSFYKTDLKNQLARQDIHAVLVDEEPVIEIQERKTGVLQDELTVQQVNHADVQLVQPYVLQALKQGTIPAQEKISLLRYQAEISALICSTSTDVAKRIKDLKVQIPRDPWLAHWILKPNTYQNVRWNKSEFRVPAFFDNEYADIPHPELAWYFWAPQHVGQNQQNVKYRAAELLAGTHQIQSVQVSVVKNEILVSTEQFKNKISLKDNTEIKATAIMGILDAKAGSLHLDEVFSKTVNGNYENWASIAAHLKLLPKKYKLERGGQLAIDFLTKLHQIVEVEKMNFKYLKNENIIVFRAPLLESQKPLRLQFYFGPTDLLAGLKPGHWNLAYEALQKDDIILYVGHSGLGENFKWNNITRLTSKKGTTDIDKKDRIVGIFSCYSASYFEKDLSKLMTDNSLLIMTGSAYTSSRGILGVINWVDHSILNQDSMNRFSYLNPDDFLIFKQFGKNL